MSTSPAPGERRSGRQRKQVKRYEVIPGLKRKRTDDTDDTQNYPEDDEGLDGDDDLLGLDEDEEDEGEADVNEDDEYQARRTAPKAVKARINKSTKPMEKASDVGQAELPKRRGRPKVDGNSKVQSKPKAKKVRHAGATGISTAVNGEGATGGINTDNHLFNALLNPSSSLQSVADDFLESLRASALPALAELITMVVRCCGANADITIDEVSDEDGVVGVCEDIMEAIKQAQAPPYPLISRLPTLKPLRKALAAFFVHLAKAAHTSGQLYTSDLVRTLVSWLTTMSSSSLRSFRHTSTYIAACVVGGLCQVANELEKTVSVVGRQREAEKKKKKSGAANGNDPLEKRFAEVKERHKAISEHMKDFFDGIFVHRYRDFDPEIRAECMHQLGAWMKACPSYWLDGTYLRYAGWLLSDSSIHVRLEALKALTPLYEVPGSTALPHFTARFLPRIVQIATSDTDVSVRCAALGLLTEIDAHDLWGDEADVGGIDRAKVCLLIWDTEPRVRRAAGPFFANVWAEQVLSVLESQGRKKKESDQERTKIGAKQLAALLVRLETLVDEEMSQSSEEPQSAYITRQVSARLPGAPQVESRVVLAVDALWAHLDAVSDWESLLELLLLDHTIGDDSSSPRKRKKALRKDLAPSNNESDGEEAEKVDDRWRLDEREESLLLEVFGTSLVKALAEAEADKKTGQSDVKRDITSALIPALPKLFAKYQTDVGRVGDLVMIPRLLDLDQYVELRQTQMYEQLWDDLSQQYLKHSDPALLRNAVNTMTYLLSSGSSLANINARKISELEDELFSSLRDAVAGRDELELANFEEDEIQALGAVTTRLACLFASRDLTTGMEEDEGGKQSSAWDILCALAERGRLGYRDEELMVDQCLKALNLHVVWKTKRLLSTEGDSDSELVELRRSLEDQRKVLVDKLTEYAVGTQCNPCEALRRSCFANLLTLYVLFSPVQSGGKRTPGSVLPMSLDDRLQSRCAGFIQAEMEKYAEEVGDDAEEEEAGHLGHLDGDASDVDMDGDAQAKQKPRRKKQSNEHTASKERLGREYILCDLISTFIRAMRIGVLHLRHSSVLLAHFGRFSPTVDLCLKALLDVLRDEGIRGNNGEAVAATTAKCLEDSFELYLDGTASTTSHCLALAKALSTIFVIRSSHFAILKRMPSQYVVAVHRDCIGWLFTKLQISVQLPDKKRRNRVAGLWKCMLPMLTTVEAREALQIKRHLDTAIKQSGFDITDSKLWEPLRAYEKRLMSIMAKDKAIGEAAKAATRKSTQPPTDPILEEDDAPTPTRPQPRPRPVRNADNAGHAPTEPDPDQRQANDEVLLPPAEINGMSTPLVNGGLANGKKRARDDDENDDASLDLDLDAPEDDDEQRALDNLMAAGTQASDGLIASSPNKRRRR